MCVYLYIYIYIHTHSEGNIYIYIYIHTVRDIYIYIRGGTVKLFHGSVCVTVSILFSMFREKLYCQIKIEKIRIIELQATSQIKRCKDTNKINSDFQFFFFM